MGLLVQDLRFAVRTMRRNPGVTAGTVFALALGIGATTALFSVVYSVILNPFPFGNAQRIVQYFATLRIPLLEGRMWSDPENARAAHVAGVNQTMARRLWPNAPAVGQRLRVPEYIKSQSQFVLAAPGSDGWFEIIGGAGDTPNIGLHEPAAPALYVPYTFSGSRRVKEFGIRMALGASRAKIVRTGWRGRPLLSRRASRPASC